MIRPDRIVALVLLAFSIGYGHLALDYPLLPFERSMAFKPNSLPLGLAGAGLVLSLAVLIAPGGGGLAPEATGARDFHWRRFFLVVLAMVAYALFLRPLGYVIATTAFLFAGAAILGERRYTILFIVALTGAGTTWFLVDRLLGIFLRPLPWFVGG